MENIVLHNKLVRVVKGTLLAYVVQDHVKVAHIAPGFGAYLKLNKEMITRASTIDSKSSLKLSQGFLDRVYLDCQCDTFKTDIGVLNSLKCREKVCRMVKQCFSTSTGDFLP